MVSIRGFEEKDLKRIEKIAKKDVSIKDILIKEDVIYLNRDSKDFYKSLRLISCELIKKSFILYVKEKIELNGTDYFNGEIDKNTAKTIVETKYFLNITYIKLLKYLKDNDVLNVKAFIKFNMEGLFEEFDLMINLLQSNKEEEEAINQVIEKIEEKGINVNSFKNIKLKKNNDDKLEIINSEGQVFKVDNVEKELGISFMMYESENYEDYEISFVTFIISLFKTEKIIIQGYNSYNEFFAKLLVYLDDNNINILVDIEY